MSLHNPTHYEQSFICFLFALYNIDGEIWIDLFPFALILKYSYIRVFAKRECFKILHQRANPAPTLTNLVIFGLRHFLPVYIVQQRQLFLRLLVIESQAN